MIHECQEFFGQYCTCDITLCLECHSAREWECETCNVKDHRDSGKWFLYSHDDVVIGEFELIDSLKPQKPKLRCGFAPVHKRLKNYPCTYCGYNLGDDE